MSRVTFLVFFRSPCQPNGAAVDGSGLPGCSVLKIQLLQTVAKTTETDAELARCCRSVPLGFFQRGTDDLALDALQEALQVAVGIGDIPQLYARGIGLARTGLGIAR